MWTHLPFFRHLATGDQYFYNDHYFLNGVYIQQSQNKDTAAIHLKLNELIASAENASNRLVDSEDLTEEELKTLKKFYVKLSDKAEKDNDLYTSHSLDEANDNHREKQKKIRKP